MTTPPDTATVTVTGDGDAVLDLRDGAPRQLRTGSLDAARKQAIAAVAAHARDTGQPVTVWARDPDAEHLLEVLPDGTVRPAPAPARSPFAPPEPAPEPAAEATAPAETDSEPVPAVVDAPPRAEGVLILPPLAQPAPAAATPRRRGAAVAVLTVMAAAVGGLGVWQPWAASQTAEPALSVAAATTPATATTPEAVSTVVTVVTPATPEALATPATVPASTLRLHHLTVGAPAWTQATGWEARRLARQRAAQQQARQTWTAPTPAPANGAPAPAQAPAPVYRAPSNPAPAAKPAPAAEPPSVRIYPDPVIQPDTGR